MIELQRELGSARPLTLPCSSAVLRSKPYTRIPAYLVGVSAALIGKRGVLAAQDAAAHAETGTGLPRPRPAAARESVCSAFGWGAALVGALAVLGALVVLPTSNFRHPNSWCAQAVLAADRTRLCAMEMVSVHSTCRCCCLRRLEMNLSSFPVCFLHPLAPPYQAPVAQRGLPHLRPPRVGARARRARRRVPRASGEPRGTEGRSSARHIPRPRSTEINASPTAHEDRFCVTEGSELLLSPSACRTRSSRTGSGSLSPGSLMVRSRYLLSSPQPAGFAVRLVRLRENHVPICCPASQIQSSFVSRHPH